MKINNQSVIAIFDAISSLELISTLILDFRGTDLSSPVVEHICSRVAETPSLRTIALNMSMLLYF